MLQIRALLSELCFSVDGFLMCLRVLHVAINFGVSFCKFMKGSRPVWRKFELRSALAVLVPPVIIKSDLSIDTLFRALIYLTNHPVQAMIRQVRGTTLFGTSSAHYFRRSISTSSCSC